MEAAKVFVGWAFLPSNVVVGGAHQKGRYRLMSDFSPEQSQVPPQITEKPTAVTVFGVLNIIFGCYNLYQLSDSYQMAIGALSNSGPGTRLALILLLLTVPKACLYIWLVIVGFGLLSMKKWARRGSAICAWIMILLTAIDLCMPYGPVAIKWSSFPENMRSRIVFIILLGLIKKLTYPILLLIFMQSAKVKQAFSAIGG
jgi:hypothetical protein